MIHHQSLRGVKRAFVGLAVLAVLSVSSAVKADEAPAAATDTAVMVDKAVEFLRSRQEPDGSFNKETGPAITALVATGLLRNGRTPADPMVAQALKFIEGFVQVDGGIYQPGSAYQNYETCIAMMCLVEANQGGRYDNQLAGAEKFIKGLQWDQDEGHDESSFSYGGAGYGGKKRPDLSNTQYFLDALKSIGAGEDDPAVQNALIFVSRCQNLETEHNTTPHAALVEDGGFYYTAAAGGSSQAGTEPNGGLRSYASMTYAGLKSMIFAGVGPDDPRIQAALEWLGKHYDLESNPGMVPGDSGLYYYYHTFAKALDALGQEKFVDDAGAEHDWRAELVAELAGRQRDNGAWINDNERWMEANPNLSTAYSLLALGYCRAE